MEHVNASSVLLELNRPLPTAQYASKELSLQMESLVLPALLVQSLLIMVRQNVSLVLVATKLHQILNLVEYV